MWHTYLTVSVVVYLLGSIPFGYILVKLFLKQDIRHTGSGNIGATNVARSGKKGLAIATLLLDAAKGTAAVVGAFKFYEFTHGRVVVIDCWLCHDSAKYVLGAALFVVIGHIFPLWLRFKGGKGVATALGALLVVNPFGVLVAFCVFAFTFAFTKYVSLSSIAAAVVCPIAFYFAERYAPWYASWTIFAICLLVICKHHANIRRLLNGTEPKFTTKKSPQPDPIQMEKDA